MSVPFIDLKTQYRQLKTAIDANIQTVLAHGQYILGPEVAQVEARLAERAGVGHCITVASGTDALRMILMAEDIGPGDAVFMPSFTFTATAEVAAVVGATPVFVDVRRDTFMLDPDDLTRRLEAVRQAGDLRPRAVLAVDLFGWPADYGFLTEFCDREGLLLIDDACQSFGGSLNGRPVGSLAPYSATSFFPAKPLGCYGDGGAIFTDHDEKAAILRSIRVHGQGAQRYDVARLGVNGRFDTLQAAVLLAKLDVFDRELEQREAAAWRYDVGLKDAVTLPPRIPNATSAWAQYCILTPKRDQVREKLQEQGIPTAIYYPLPMHRQPAYAHYAPGLDLPVSDALAREIVALPMHPYLDTETQDRICAAVKAAVA